MKKISITRKKVLTFSLLSVTIIIISIIPLLLTELSEVKSNDHKTMEHQPVEEIKQRPLNEEALLEHGKLENRISLMKGLNGDNRSFSEFGQDSSRGYEVISNADSSLSDESNRSDRTITVENWRKERRIEGGQEEIKFNYNLTVSKQSGN